MDTVDTDEQALPPGAYDGSLYLAAQVDVERCRAHYIAAVLAQTEGTEGRLSGKQSLLMARSVLHQALQIRDAARGDTDARP